MNKPRITSVDGWKKVLNKELEQNTTGFDFIHDVLIEAYYSPNRTIFCGELENKIGRKDINLRVGDFRNRIRAYGVVDFDEQLRGDTGTDCAWNIPFYSNKKLNKDGKFCWVLRDELSQAMEEMELVKSDDTRVMTFPINGTEEIIYKYKIHAHPVKRGYPTQITPFIAFRFNGGIIEKIYKLIQVKECSPSNIDVLKDQLTNEEFQNLSKYVQERYETFGFGEANVKYRFYFLEDYKVLHPRFVMRKNNQNAKVYSVDELINGYTDNNKVLFCNVAYMKYYDYAQFNEISVNGGQYAADTGDVFEKYNFHRCEDGTVKGFVETRYAGGYNGKDTKSDELFIENIDQHYKNFEEIENVTVIFCAKNPNKNVDSTDIVGWYKNAKVYRNRKEYLGRFYNIEAEYQNAILLPEYKRNLDISRITSNKENIDFGQANVWYANKVEHKPLVSDILSYIDQYSDEKFDKDSKRLNTREDERLNDIINTEEFKIVKPFEYTDELVLRKDPRISQQGISVYKRDRQKSINAIIHAHFKCEVDHSHLTFKKKSDGLPYLEAHHLIPMAQQDNFEYSLDVEENIISLCSQCHNEIHYGKHADKLITKLYYDRIKLLKKKKMEVTLEKLLSYYGF